MEKRPGLKNYGNTCFLNASIQALATCDTLAKAKTLGQFFQTLRMGDPVDPMGPRALVMRAYPEFRNNRQHDAHEWIMRLLEIVEKTSAEQVRNGFDGKFSVTVLFPDCGHANRHDEDFRTLSLDLPGEGGTLATALKAFGDTVEVESTCDEHCKDTERKRAMKAMRVATIPKHLIIQWKRFERRGVKVNRRVPCPPAFEAIGCRFVLTATVNHAGATANSGHYTACARHGNQWWMANDSHTMKIEDRHALKAAEAAYLLFYSKVDA